MPTCFVIQPFDNGRFDKLFVDTFEPAIRDAGIEPYRVDQDPNSFVPIEDIEAGIRRADVCFAEISTNNPNVWYELGFAIAARKPVIMVCGEDRDRFPFDVQHRSIIKYKSESARDFKELGKQITRRIAAAMAVQIGVESIENLSPAATSDGLTDHELVALITISNNGFEDDPITIHFLRQEMRRAGYTDVACTLSVRGLEKKGYISKSSSYDGNSEYWGFFATETGLDWLVDNQHQLKLKDSPKDSNDYSDFETDDDLPF